VVVDQISGAGAAFSLSRALSLKCKWARGGQIGCAGVDPVGRDEKRREKEDFARCVPTPNEARTSAKTLAANALYFPIWPGDQKYSLNGLTNINWAASRCSFYSRRSLSLRTTTAAYYVELLDAVFLFVPTRRY
jgi:hypothetical protein